MSENNLINFYFQMKIITRIKKLILKQIINIKTYGTRELFRKFYLLSKLIVMIPIYIIAIIPCVIMRLISPWLIVRILKLPAGNFGDFIQFTAMFYCYKKLNINQPKKRHLDLVYILRHNNKIVNKQLAIMWKRKLNFLSGYLLHPISKINKLIPGGEIYSLEHLYSKRVRNIDNLLDFHNSEML